jgi:hypothetical protein
MHPAFTKAHERLEQIAARKKQQDEPVPQDLRHKEVRVFMRDVSTRQGMRYLDIKVCKCGFWRPVDVTYDNTGRPTIKGLKRNHGIDPRVCPLRGVESEL